MPKSQKNTNYDIATTRGNTPLNNVPADYLPEGAQSHWLILKHGPDTGKKLFFYDVVIGDGTPEATLYFVHGNPESSYTYRQTMEHVIANTDKTLRIIAMDHIGFGLSDQASFEMVDYHHANNLKQLIEHLDVRDATLVIHDWGGAIGIGAFIDSPERISNLVLMNTTIFPMPPQGITYTNFPFPGLLAWNRLGHWMPAKAWKHIPPLVMFSPASRPKFASHCMKFTWRSLT
ncbi:MAG: alpha/beta fold hydrolase, partial [Pseudomonadota bacterium]|nr:alpha/beta fold hydrolase [Pseudomonadota bacterium]